MFVWGDKEASTWDSETAWFADAAFASLRKVVGAELLESGNLRVLDFGCGTGLLSERLAPFAREIVAVDVSPAMLAVLEAKVSTHDGLRSVVVPVLGDATHPKLHEKAPFDLIICSSVCGFLGEQQYAETAALLAKLLRPAGGMWVQWDWPATKGEHEGEDYGLTEHQIASTLAAAGLEDVSVSIAFQVEVEGQVAAPLLGVARKK